MSDVSLEDTGPIDYVIVEFPEGVTPDGSALQELSSLVDAGIINLLDLAFVQKGADGTVSGVDINQLDFSGDVDVTLFAEASSGLLGHEDFVEAAEALLPGSAAAILVYENAWAAPFAKALRAKGAQLVASGRIPVQGILAALDALEGTDPVDADA